ncbi:uncharacterized protein LOC122390761 isoform X2 [Amphibalanus amphitrite]|uniref:uncharacterized protein LOC122390761 isoform X2 n=1 Tax=Amphibalanus amphitrite TaxID=1232801 RepID=UPI001C8FE80E|nr:uncharacterized protein LOC122390761 isoform X2 [Amphibalanus amphitrite]
MRNVEIKARVRDLERTRQLAAQLSGSDGQQLDMRDTFFPAAHGRLKLREQTGAPNRLIFYDRPDTTGPKLSDYKLANLGEEVGPLREVLAAALGVRGDVEKRRYLYLVGQTRVHVDRVTGLGDFVELEVCLTDVQTAEDGQAVAERLMEQLGVAPDDLIDCAYMDMLLKKGDGEASS